MQETSHSHQPPSDVYSQQLTAEGFGPASIRQKVGSSAAQPLYSHSITGKHRDSFFKCTNGGTVCTSVTLQL